MWGQERANILVYEELKRRGVQSLFVTHREWGHVHVQPALDALQLSWTTARYAGRFERRMGLRRWLTNLWDVARASVELQRGAQPAGPAHHDGGGAPDRAGRARRGCGHRVAGRRGEADHRTRHHSQIMFAL